MQSMHKIRGVIIFVPVCRDCKSRQLAPQRGKRTCHAVTSQLPPPHTQDFLSTPCVPSSTVLQSLPASQVRVLKVSLNLSLAVFPRHPPLHFHNFRIGQDPHVAAINDGPHWRPAFLAKKRSSVVPGQLYIPVPPVPPLPLLLHASTSPLSYLF